MHYYLKVFLVVVFVSATSLIAKLMLVPRTSFSPIRVKYRNPEEAYESFMSEYNNTLGHLNTKVYNDPGRYTITGPPVGTLSKQNESGRTRVKKILTWTTFYGQVNFIPKNPCVGQEFSGTCEVTTDKNELLKSDAVVFHPIDLQGLPLQRLPHQRWVYYLIEPPFLASIEFAKYDYVFNWTLNYRVDADIPAPYYKAKKLEKTLSDAQYEELLQGILSKKKKLVAIMHKNCFPKSNRFEVLRELQRYVPVDFYGDCGNLVCQQGTELCRQTMSSYKFYLSFENSRCRNYITEKVNFPLHYWSAVPIVLGAPEEDYARVMPPDSYINVDGFRSIKKLAEYIVLLDENPKLYEKYHTWRKTHAGTAPTLHMFCDLCKALHNDSLPVQTYTDFAGWYGEDVCDTSYPFTKNLLLWKLYFARRFILWIVVSIGGAICFLVLLRYKCKTYRPNSCSGRCITGLGC